MVERDSRSLLILKSNKIWRKKRGTRPPNRILVGKGYATPENRFWLDKEEKKGYTPLEFGYGGKRGYATSRIRLLAERQDASPTQNHVGKGGGDPHPSPPTKKIRLVLEEGKGYATPPQKSIIGW